MINVIAAQMSQNMQGAFPDSQLEEAQKPIESQLQEEQRKLQEHQQQQQSINVEAQLSAGVMQQQDQQQQQQTSVPTGQPQLPAGFGNAGIPPAMLLPNQPFAALLQPGGGANAPSNADLNSAGGGNNQATGGMDVNSELKRLQQLQQQMNAQSQNNNALLLTNANSAPAPGNNQMNAAAAAAAAAMQNNQAALLQQMFDQQQKLQNNGGNLMGGAPAAPAAGFNPFLSQPGLLQDARLLLAQSQFGLIPGQANAMPEAPLPSPHSLFHRDGSRRMRGGVIEPFPEKLHRLLIEVEAAGRSDVISFVANGRAFAIHKPDKFFKEIVPLYFRQSRLSSFKRQLNLYGFELINTGPSRGGYFHELFVKDRPELCRRMRRVAVKVSTSGGSNNKQQQNGGEGGDDDKGNEASGSGEAGNVATDGAANAHPSGTGGEPQGGNSNNGPIV